MMLRERKIKLSIGDGEHDYLAEIPSDTQTDEVLLKFIGLMETFGFNVGEEILQSVEEVIREKKQDSE